MVAIVSVLGGALIGWMLGRNKRAYITFVSVWLIVFAIQTMFLLGNSDSVRDRTTGAWDPAYLPVASLIFLAGLGVVYLAAALHERRRPT